MNATQLIIKSKKRLTTQFLGRNLSKLKGAGLDFKDFREYVYGEDAKKIDWKISAKVNKPLIKEFEENKELRIIIAVLKSGSMHFGSNKLKSTFSAEILSDIGVSAISQDNKVQVIFLGKEKKVFKPTKNIKKLTAYVDYALNTRYLQEEISQNDIDFLNGFKKSLLFLIGDFFKPFDLTRIKHETYAIIVRDLLEEDPPFEGNVELVSPITLNGINVNFNKKTKSKITSHIEKTERVFINEFKKKGIKYTKIYTHEEPFYKLMELLR